ncbi:hypothetical protein [Streptomyces violascens]|uniref:hypothetical protein n=1 Tax=Streptomyces violascens TaxID=67381 RepID=UPI00167308A1|nr:hypothetical protein [Streptomyces violascens]GGU40239.1 hypothetical protein GCM10010289_71280 [Streptomyces violascens]
MAAAVRAAGLLLTAEREAFGSPGSVQAGAFYGVLEQILAEYPPLTEDQEEPAEELGAEEVAAEGAETG